jgi:ABC-type spermidine/putrescine transport system permease subunit I
MSAIAARLRPSRHSARVLGYMTLPVGLLICFFVAPLIVLTDKSFRFELIAEKTGFTLDNYTRIFGNHLYVHILLQTIEIATIAMAVELLIAFPLAYILAFKAGKFEIPLLLALVLADELNPMVRIYAWRMLLGKEGLINTTLETLGIINHPINALLFSRFSVILVLVTGSIVFASIPIYASMKAVDRGLFEAARDLGASWFQIFRKILLPLVAPGVFISIALVFIPFFTEFATPGLVGGRSGYMIGNTIAEQISATGEFGGGTAMSLVLLVAAGVFSLIAYAVTRMKSLGTAA